MNRGPRDEDDEIDARTAPLFAGQPADAPGPTTEPITPPAPAPADPEMATTRKAQDDFATRATTRVTPMMTWPMAAGPASEITGGQVLFDKYVVERPLGRGGMGSVWLVRHREIDVQRALKLIVPAFAIDPEIRSRFRREARVMAKFTHPNVVTVHDARLAEGVAYIEMEYVSGRSLNTLLRPGEPMPLDWIARILIQLCDVLQVAHDQQIVHRDLKPSNLMLLDGQPPGREHLKVLDFGIAKILDPGADDAETEEDVRTGTGMFIGTAQYSSPEQSSGARVDGRSDIYSVGVILYELLAGGRPFAGPLVIRDHAVTPPPPISGRVPGVAIPAEIEALVLRCLAKDPADRPQTAAEVAEAFLRALPGGAEAFGTIPATRWPGPRPGRRRWRTARRLAPVLLAGAATLILGAAWALIPRNPRASGTGQPTAKAGAPPVVPAAGVIRWPDPTFPPKGFHDADGAIRAGGRPSALTCLKDGSRLVLVEWGTFAMGRMAGFETFPDDDKAPAHRETVLTFYMQEAEVTNGQMAAYFAANDPNRKSAEYLAWREAVDDLIKVKVTEDEAQHHPATRVSHQTAARYAHWAGGRLPTEAEWEFAARSRGQQRLYVWPEPKPPGKTSANIDTAGEILAPDGVGSIPTQPVMSYKDDRTEQGVFDLTGNVREWCRDPWPVAPGQAPEFVVRGGSFMTHRNDFRTTGPRGHEGIDQTAGDLGFRIVVECP